MHEQLRSTKQRKQDVIRRLESDQDVWISTASPDGRPHLVPLSLSWDSEQVICTTEKRSVTFKNVVATGLARLAVGTTREVVLIDVEVSTLNINDAEAAIAERFVQHTGWDPRSSQTEMAWLIMKPMRLLAWNSEPELEGRVVMRKGQWLV